LLLHHALQVLCSVPFAVTAQLAASKGGGQGESLAS
jgi:hypothetical protein